MNVQKSIEFMDFMKNVKDDIVLNYGNNLQSFFHIYLYVL